MEIITINDIIVDVIVIVIVMITVVTPSLLLSYHRLIIVISLINYSYLTIIPRTQMVSESIAHEA